MRLPWAPLETAVLAGRIPHRMDGSCGCLTGGGRVPGACMTVREIGEVLGRDGSQVDRWRKRGSIPTHLADELADRLGLHRWDLWPELCDIEIAETEAEAEARAERRREWRRKYRNERYASDAEYRAAELARNREWKQANPELNRKNSRNWYRQNAEYAREYAREYRARKRAEREQVAS